MPPLEPRLYTPAAAKARVTPTAGIDPGEALRPHAPASLPRRTTTASPIAMMHSSGVVSERAAADDRRGPLAGRAQAERQAEQVRADNERLLVRLRETGLAS